VAEAKHVVVSWDWKEQPMENGLEEALKKLGIFTYETPSDVGSDQYGFIFSTKPLTPKQITEIDKAQYE
jgi:hypothetical protein